LPRCLKEAKGIPRAAKIMRLSRRRLLVEKGLRQRSLHAMGGGLTGEILQYGSFSPRFPTEQ
jgi:hypothetical protein